MSRLVLDGKATRRADATGLEPLADVTQELRRTEIAVAVAGLRTRSAQPSEAPGALTLIERGRWRLTVRTAVDACAGGYP